MSEITEFLKPEIIALFPDEANWVKESMGNKCRKCGAGFESDVVFHIFKSVGDEQWSMSFHYECAFEEGYFGTFRDDNTNGWISENG